MSLPAFIPVVAIAPGLGARIRAGHHGRETVLWLHDYGLDSSCWSELWARLPAWRHVGIDLPGHGISLPAVVEESLPALAERLAGVARSEGARHVVALGLGSLIALQMAVDDAGALATVTLASPWVGGAALAHPAVDMQEVLAFEQAIDGPGPWMRDRLLDAEGGLYTEAARVGRLRPLLDRAIGGHGFWELRDGWLVRMAQHEHGPEELARVRASTLLITGERCGASDARAAVTLGHALAGSRHVTLAGAGSLALLEAPEGACAAIEGHLRAAADLVARD